MLLYGELSTLQDSNMVERKSRPQTFSLLKLSLDCSGEFVRLNEW